ncbi:helix-turn-helix domain-containing protein [Siminovitchia fortis]|uniref:DNA-binding protein n=1 Tax=Siminovitchia fortis TaxID=254758 RepID=A0A443IZ47_9BACI|nr:helix-turn-helix domain-containing protein [Siminovitchia fortis]RWR13582.1 DNA-binding protein [Siminovitchia fortis]WHY81961.1 helix-turn-helix domain-containing protein [Siminovitchia fortis]
MKKHMAVKTGVVFKGISDVMAQVNKENISENARQYVQLLHQSIEIDQEKEMFYLELNDDEKTEVEHVLKDVFHTRLPEYMPVTEVAQMLNVTPQMVRRYCAEGKIKAKQRMENSGKWLIPTEQFLAKPEFSKHLKQKEINRMKSMKAIDLVLQGIDEEEEED